MEKEILDQTHPAYDAERWNELLAIAKGGKIFHKLVDRFLPKNPMEPELRYELRKKRARYYSYTGAIINLYASWLFAAGFDSKPYERNSQPPAPIAKPDTFYGAYQENVGGETTLKSFMKDRFREAMTVGKAVWLAEIPQVIPGEEPKDKAEWEKRGLGNARLLGLAAEDLLDWETDDDGALEWAIVKKIWKERRSFAAKRNIVVEQWRIYDRVNVALYELHYEDNKPPSKNTIVPLKSTTPHGFKRVPITCLDLPQEMCIGEQTCDAQISHFQHDNALSWAIAACCYPTPIFKLSGEDKPTLGAGYAIFLGENEELEWTSPPSDSFDTIAKNRDSKRDEIFRIVHQMAQGLDNNAETVGRSADSKEIDAAATRIMLNAYGEIVGKSIEETYELISEMRGDDNYEWSVEGFTGYDTATASSLLGNIQMAKALGIPSNTFQREISKKAALALVPELDPRVKDSVRKEIDEYDFTESGDLLEERLQSEALTSQEKISTSTNKSSEKQTQASLKSQEKNASLAAKSKAAQKSAPPKR